MISNVAQSGVQLLNRISYQERLIIVKNGWVIQSNIFKKGHWLKEKLEGMIASYNRWTKLLLYSV